MSGFKLFSLLIAYFYSVSAVPLQQFYPFGSGQGDTLLPPNDDDPSPIITLNRIFPFFGTDQFTIVVNNNGLISFRVAERAFIPTPFPLNGSALIAPFWGDVDTRGPGGGSVWYRESVAQSDLTRTESDIKRAYPVDAANFRTSSVFIATWDHVGYFNINNDRTNTFQCVLATDGFMSFVIFLYADDLIQWGDQLTSSAQVGFNAGDGINFFSHNDSRTDDIINIDRETYPEGHGRPGVLIFKVDGRMIDCAENASNADVALIPSRGNQLGGDIVFVRGFCLLPNDVILCNFDGIAKLGVYVSRTTALCITPVMRKAGNVDVIITIFRRGVRARPVLRSSFTNVSPATSNRVDFNTTPSSDDLQLYLKSGNTVRLSWTPEDLLPDSITTNASMIPVHIQLYQQFENTVRGIGRVLDWGPIDGIPPMTNLPNDGSEDFIVPQGLVMMSCPNQNLVCPVAFKVSIVKGSTVNITGAGQIDLPSRNAEEAGIWSGAAYLQSDEANSASLSQICSDWSSNINNNIPTSILNQLLTCPPLRAQAEADNRFRREELSRPQVSSYPKAAMKFYHPDDDGVTCYVQIVTTENPIRSEGQHCCYAENGTLITGQTGGGSADKVSPMRDYNMHTMNDLLPYVFCCRGGSMCPMYYRSRPSISLGAPQYQLPVPACVYGDPHIVTLDGHKYTYNGKGEFILIETHDNTFTLQGRMEQAKDSDGNDAPGTVFTALVARQSGSVNSTVEFQVGRQGGLEVLVNRMRVNFGEAEEQDFQQVMIMDRGNDTVLAEFSGGSNLEIRVENRIISVMLITLPNHYRSLTRGLMGNYNRKPDDDFISRRTTFSIPVDSSAEDIFTFGNTWMMIEASESLFSYNRPGESFQRFRDPSFRPIFEPTFENPEEQQRAVDICGDNQFCLFDVAATKNEDIGMATMQGVRDFDTVVELAEPIVCTPPCGNGTCIATNTCSCSMGYSGERCTNIILSECDQNMCQNNGTCVQHVRSFTCTCPSGYIGIFCQEKEPPFNIRLINSSPRIEGDDVISVEFIPSKPLKSANCSLLNVSDKDCSISRVKFTDLQPGSYRLVITAESVDGEKYAERRDVTICDVGRSLGVHLINEGITVSGRCAYVQFRGCGEIDHFRCKLDDRPITQCLSPLRYCDLEEGAHEILLSPMGKEGDDSTSEPLIESFMVI